MKTKILIPLLLIIGVFILSCSKSNNNNPILTTTTYTAALTGASETPPDTSKATGTANLVYNPATMILSGTVTFTGITPIAGHIHKGGCWHSRQYNISFGKCPFQFSQ